MVELTAFGPGSHPDWSWTNEDDVKLIALLVAIAVAPIVIRWGWRDMQRGGGFLASLGAPPPLDMKMRDQPYRED